MCTKCGAAQGDTQPELPVLTKTALPFPESDAHMHENYDWSHAQLRWLTSSRGIQPFSLCLLGLPMPESGTCLHKLSHAGPLAAAAMHREAPGRQGMPKPPTQVSTCQYQVCGGTYYVCTGSGCLL